MDIYKHNEILLKWIRSCQTAHQLDLFTKLVTEFEAIQFYNEINSYKLELAKKDLLDAIMERRIIVAGTREPMQLKTPRLFIPNESAVYISE